MLALPNFQRDSTGCQKILAHQRARTRRSRLLDGRQFIHSPSQTSRGRLAEPRSFARGVDSGGTVTVTAIFCERILIFAGQYEWLSVKRTCWRFAATSTRPEIEKRPRPTGHCPSASIFAQSFLERLGPPRQGAGGEFTAAVAPPLTTRLATACA